MFVIKYKKLFIGISVAMVVLSIAAIAVFGLRLGIDFTGGSALQLSYSKERPTVQFLQDRVTNAGFGGTVVQPIGEKGMSFKTRDISDAERLALITVATDNGAFPATQESFTSVGPSIGKELKNKAILSIILVFIAIIFFVAYAFRKVSKPVSSWKYGFAVILALLHDVIIPTGVFAVLGKVIGADVDPLFIVALLTTFALSISDTIVVFDRVRENLEMQEDDKVSFERIVGDSLSQTFVRSLNTSIIVVVVVVALAIFGPDSTRLFATILATGMFFGTYSSIFLASPLLVLMERKRKNS
jgi:preprotein translocase subunit SecF